MSVINIKATIECDECGTRFSVNLDPSRRLQGWTVFDEAEDMVRGGVDSNLESGSTSVQEGKMLCNKCTEEADRQPEIKIK